MSSERPTRDEIRRGMTVTVQQDQPNDDGDPIVGEVSQVLTEERTEPNGVTVELQSGAVWNVLERRPKEA